jgi:hypothetical protein
LKEEEHIRQKSIKRGSKGTPVEMVLGDDDDARISTRSNGEAGRLTSEHS